ncbi:MAG TPA: hypothetical protein DHW34_03195 [Actinobacteria bacterium]|nr:hypothetical protein [Actinomycetota bacterium]HCK79005.1 hypothetical protein [Actinomycetota bacterium]
MLRTVADLLEVWASAVAVGMPVHQGLDEAWQVVGIPLRNGSDNGDRWSVLADPAVPATRLPQLCWQLHRSAGIAIGPVLHRCAESVRDEITMAEEAMAQAAAPLATARLLAALPIAGPLLGAAVGADVVAVLFGTSIGRACLIVGLGLDLLGLWWMRRIVRAAGRSS